MAGAVNDNLVTNRFDSIDETGTVETAGLIDDNTTVSEANFEQLDARLKELIEVCGVDEEILKMHGSAPGTKAEGVIQLIYENLNGLNSRGNDKLEMAKDLIHVLEADIVCYNEHRMNLMHKDNKNGFPQLF